MKYSFILFSLFVILSCSKTKESCSAISSCTQSLIDSALSKSKGSLFYKIDAYLYNDTMVYLYYTGCCDRFNELKDRNCKYLFSPSGGFSGAGDGTHPTFFTDAKFVAVVWEDPRQ